MSLPQMAEKGRRSSHGNLWRLLRRATLLFLCVVQAGCAFARLEGVLKRERVARPGEIQDVQVIRKGARVPPGLGMELEKGDEIRTDGETTVTVSFSGGSEIILRPGTHIRILNPSILAILGEVFIKVQGVFQVETEYVTAGAEGTEYLVALGRDDEASIVVLDGVVRVVSKARRWRPISLGKFEQGTIRRQETPQRSQVRRDRLNEIIHWVNRVEQLTQADTELLMPNVVGLPEVEAKNIITRGPPAALSVKKRITGRYPIGIVVSQSVPAGERVARGASIVLGVEAEPVRVPSFKGRRLEQAKRMIQRRRLFLGKLTQRITGQTSAGTVIHQTPQPGSVVPAGSAVDLEIEEESVVAPNFVGRHIDQAQRSILDERLRLGRVDEEITGRTGAGVVLRQTPQSGTRVRPGTTIDLVVEAESVVMPAVVGQGMNQARQVLHNTQLSVGRVREELRERVRAGTVLSQDPRSGTRVRPGRTVDLVVAVTGVRVPKIRGLSLRQAQVQLDRAGLNLGRTTRDQSTRYARGTIMEQVPAPGTLVQSGTSIELVISTGPPQCIVPNVFNLTYEQASSRLKNAGFRVGTVSRIGRGNLVSQQDPDPRTSRLCNSAVNLWIGTIQ